MPVYRLALPSEIGRGHVRPVADIPGHEAGRILHAGACPLRGQVQLGGVRGPNCSAECADPTPPVYVATIYRGLVLKVDVDARTATVWNLLTKQPEEVPLPDDEAYPARATVDASAGLRKLHATWTTWRALEEEQRAAAKKKADDAKAARIQADKEREERARAARAAAVAHAEEKRQRRLASIIRAGSRLRVVSDAPGVAARNRGIKPRNRTPSLVGTEGFCSVAGSYHEPHVFMRIADGSSIRVLRSCVRVVFSDGTLGEADVPEREVQPKGEKA